MDREPLRVKRTLVPISGVVRRNNVVARVKTLNLSSLTSKRKNAGIFKGILKILGILLFSRNIKDFQTYGIPIENVLSSESACKCH